MQLSGNICLDIENTIVIYAFLSQDVSCISLPFPLPRLSWHSCREQSNDACPSETWWIVMNRACVFIWRKARGRQREEGRGLWERGRRMGQTASENRASLAALMQHEWLWEARWWLTRDALILYTSFTWSPLLRVTQLISHSAQDGDTALIKTPHQIVYFLWVWLLRFIIQ